MNCLNLDGLTPLYLCVSSQSKIDPEIVEILLRDYAQHGVRDAAGSTELHQVGDLHCLVEFRIDSVSLTTFGLPDQAQSNFPCMVGGLSSL